MADFLSNEKIKEQYDWLVSIGHSKVRKKGKTLDYFKKTRETRQELTKAYSAAQKAKKNQPGFDPEDTGFRENVTPEGEKSFKEKLNSKYVTQKARSAYLAAEDAVRRGGGRAAHPRLKAAQSAARKTVNGTYTGAVRREEIAKALSIQESDPSSLTDEQRRLIEGHEGRNERRSAVERGRREERGLRSRIATLEQQEIRLAESLETFTKKTVKHGYKAFLTANPQYRRVAPGGSKWSSTDQFHYFWDMLPEYEKANWKEEIRKIYENNKEIIQKYHKDGKVVPRDVQVNEMWQLHHILPRKVRRSSVRGGHFPAQTTAVQGDSFQARKSRHGLLHDPALDYLYDKFSGQNNMVFDFSDPNVISRETKDGKKVPVWNKGGMSYLRDAAASIMETGPRVAKKVLTSLSPTAIVPTLSGLGLSMLPNKKAQAWGDALLYMGDPLFAPLTSGEMLNRPREYTREGGWRNRLVDPTWRRTGLLETQGDKSTILDRKRKSIWT